MQIAAAPPQTAAPTQAQGTSADRGIGAPHQFEQTEGTPLAKAAVGASVGTMIGAFIGGILTAGAGTGAGAVIGAIIGARMVNSN